MSAETKWTHGPWARDGHSLSTILHCTAERGSPKAKHICGDYEVIARCEGENWPANSCLIAAAPDLYEALERSAAALQAVMKANNNITEQSLICFKGQRASDPATPLSDILNAADAALAKAKGEPQ